MQKKLPQTIISAIRRRAAAAAKWQIADAQISAYCKKHGIKTYTPCEKPTQSSLYATLNNAGRVVNKRRKNEYIQRPHCSSRIGQI